MNVFELEVVCERDQRCVRRFEFLASHSLWDVHRGIVREFDLDNDHLWSFYLSGEYHDPDTEFGGTPLDGGTAAGARLGELDLDEGMTIAYVFDFGDDLRHSVRVVRIAVRQAGMEYPRLTHSAGAPPSQYRPEDDESEDHESDVEGSEDVAESMPATESVPAEEPTLPADLVERVRVAMDRELESDDADTDQGGFDRRDLPTVARVLETCTTVEQLGALCEAVRGDVFRWIATVLDRGVTTGCAEDVLPLTAQLARAAPDTKFQFLWASALLRLGRRDEALAAMASYQPEDRPESIRHRIRTAVLRAEAGDDDAAERELRALLALRWLSRDARENTVHALAPILKRSKRGAEATRLLDELTAKRMAHILRRPLPARRAAPKVGRNDPCPCGSGRKFKKCCALNKVGL
jgi:hypothetical protein